MARLDEWLHIISPLVAAGARAPEILAALEQDVAAARYLASVAAGQKPEKLEMEKGSHTRNRTLNAIRRYLRETLPAREDTARLARDLAAGRRQKREAGYQARLHRALAREGLALVVASATPAAGTPARGPLARVPAIALAAATEPADPAIMSRSARIARDLANAKHTVEIDPELAKLL